MLRWHQSLALVVVEGILGLGTIEDFENLQLSPAVLFKT